METSSLTTCSRVSLLPTRRALDRVVAASRGPRRLHATIARCWVTLGASFPHEHTTLRRQMLSFLIFPIGMMSIPGVLGSFFGRNIECAADHNAATSERRRSSKHERHGRTGRCRRRKVFAFQLWKRRTGDELAQRKVKYRIRYKSTAASHPHETHGN